MLDQLDMLILEKVSEGAFELTIPYSTNSRSIERTYRSRGFLVRSDSQDTKIIWRNPDIDPMVVPNKKIYSYFTAQQLYFVLTKGKDLRRLTNVSVYEKLIREQTIVDTYEMDKLAVYNLFKEAIQKAEYKGYTVVVNDLGIITSKMNPIDHTNCDGQITPTTSAPPTGDARELISKDDFNNLTTGSDNKLYVENPLKTTEW